MTRTGRTGNFPTGFTGPASWLANRLGLRQHSGGSGEGSTRNARRELRRSGRQSSMDVDDEEDDDEYKCLTVTDDDDDEESDRDEGADSHKVQATDGGESQQVGLKNHPLGHLIRCRTAASEASARFGKVKPGEGVNTFSMLAGRELNVSRNGKFSCAESCHIGSNFLPFDGPSIVDQLHSRAYTGQFSSDGSLFVAGFKDQRIRIYNVEKQWMIQKDVLTRNLRWTVTDTALSPDHRFLVYASITPLVHLVNVGSESGGVQSLANVTDIHWGLDFAGDDRGENAFGIWSLQFSNDGGEIVAGTNDKSIYVYDLEANKATFRVVAHKDDVNAVCFADKSSHLIYSGSDDNNCKPLMGTGVGSPLLFTAISGVGVLEGHLEGITFIDSFGDGQYFISNSKDQTIKLWDIRKMSSGPPRSKYGKVPAFRWDYRWDNYPGRNKGLKHPYDQSIMTYEGHVVLRTLIRCYFSPAFSTGQKYIYTGSHDGCVYIYDVVTGEEVSKLSFHRVAVRDVSWHPTQPMLVSSSWDGNIAKWEHLHGDKPNSSQIPRARTEYLFDSDSD